MQRKNLKSVSVSNLGPNSKARRYKTVARALAAGIGLMGMAAGANADSAWNGTTGDFASSNWSNGNPTTGKQNADVDNGGIVTISATSGTVNVNDIRAGDATAPVASSGLSTGTWIQTGDTATVNGWFRLATNGSTSSGTYNLSGGTLITTLYSNIGESGVATMNVSGTGVWNDTNGGDDEIAIGGSGSGGGSGQATLNMSGGTINTGSSEFWIGNGSATSKGVVNVSAGTLIVGNWLSVGRAGGSGTLNLSGGVVSKTGTSGHISLTGIGGTGVINQTGGTLTSSTDFWVTENGPGTWNLSNGVATITGGINVDNGGATGAVGILNMTGGTLTANSFFKGGTAGTGTVNFNGGQFISGASSTTFMTGLTAANILAGGLNFNTSTFNDTIAQPLLGSATDGGLNLTGTGTLTLSGASTFQGPIAINSTALNYARTDTYSLNQVISGSGNLIMSGSGTMTLNGSNTYAGTTTITGGVVYAPKEANIPNYLTKLTVSGTGEIALGVQVGGTGPGFTLSDIQTVLSEMVTGGTTTTSPTLGLDTTNGNYTYANNITIPIGFDKRGANTLTLTGTNSFTGRLTVTAGTLDIGANTSDAGTTAIGNPGVLINNTGTGTGTLLQEGGSVSSGTNETWIGNSAGSTALYNISGGTLSASNWIAIGRNNAVGTLNLSGTGVVNKLTVTGALTLGSITGNGTINQTGGTINNPLSNTYIGETGPGTYNMSGGTANLTNVYVDYNLASSASAGTLNLNGGTFSANFVQRNSSIGSSIVNFNGGTLQAAASSTLFVGSTLSTSGTMVTNVLAGGAIINTNGFNDTIAASLVGSAGDGGLTKLGAGTLTVTGTNTYTGPTTINGGTLMLGSTGSLPSGTSLYNSATINFNGQYPQPAGSTTPGLTLNNLNASNGSNFQFLLNSSGVSYFNFTGAANVASGALITVTTPAAQTLAPGSYNLFTDSASGNLSSFALANNFVITGGFLYPLSLATSSSADVLTVGTGQVARLFFTGNTSNDASVITNYSSDSAGANVATTAVSAYTDVVFTASSGNTANFTTTLGSLTGVNSLEFAGNNSTPVNLGGPGTLSITANANTFAAGVGIVVDSSAPADTISANLNLPISESFTNNSPSIFTISGAIGSANAGTILTLSGASGTGGFLLSGTNTYTGGTVVNAGTVKLGSNSALGASGNTLTLSGTGTVDLNGSHVTQSSLNLAGGNMIGSLGTGVLTLSGTTAAGPTILISTITGTGYTNSPVSAPIASGAIALTGTANSIVKPLASGNPVISSNIQLGTGATTTVTLADTSGDAAGELSLTGVISGSGSLVQDNSAVVPGVTMGNQYDWGTLVLTGSNTYSGGTTIAFGRTVIASSNALGTGSVTILQRSAANGGSGGTLQLGNRAYTATSAPLAVGVIATGITVPNQINLGGALSGDYGQGIWNDSGANTLSGNVTLTNAVQNIQVASGSLIMSGNISESFTGATLVKNNAGGPLTLSGTNNTFTGGVTVNAGELIAGASNAFGIGGPALVVSGADANIAAGTLANPMTINGSGVDLGGALTGSATSLATSGVASGTINLGTAATNARIGAQAADFLTVTGPIVNGTGTTAGVNLDISGLGTGSATSAGFGTVILKGVNTYTGNTTVVRGNLIVDGSNLTAGQSNINATGTIQIGSSGTVGDQGTFTLQNGGVVTTTNTFYSSNSNSNTTVNILGGTLTSNIFQLGNEAVGSGISSTDLLTQTGGTINSGQYFSIGFSGSGTATANLSGGTLNVHTNSAQAAGDFEVGIFDQAVAIVNIGTGETVRVENNGNMAVGSQNSTVNNTVNQTGGTVTFYSDAGITAGGTGGLYLGRYSAPYNSSGTETYNLNGGTLTVPFIAHTSLSTATASQGVLNFNGGTLVAAASSTTFMQGLTTAALQANGGTIDANGKNITIAQVISDGTTPGLLTLQDSAAIPGSIKLTGASTFSGGVNLNSGALLVANPTASATGSGTVTLNGGTLGSGTVGIVGGAVVYGTGNHTIAPGGVGSVGNLILAGGLVTNNTPSNGGITTINFDLGPGVTSTTVGSFHVITDGDLLTYGAGTAAAIDPGTPITIATALSGTPAPTGLYRLMTDQDGSVIPSLTGDFSLATPAPTGDTTWALDYSDDPGFIDLDVVSTVVAAMNLTWNNTGGASPSDGLTWDTVNNNWNNGSAATTFSNSRMDTVTFNDANNGHYNVSVPSTVTPGSTTFNNSAGNYNVSGAGGIGGTGALVKLGTGTVTLATTDTYTGGTNVSGGTLILSGKGAFPAATALTIGAAGIVQIAPHAAGSANIVVVTASSLSNSGELDLTNNDLIVRGGSLSTINGQLKTGFSNGWNASVGSIFSSTAAASTSHLTAVGVLLNDNSAHPGTALYSSFDGSSTIDGDVLVKYTYYGDANLDGAVDGSDYTLIDNGFNNNLSGWYNGDFNYDGKVDGSDYTLIDNAFNTQGATLGSNPAALFASSTAQIAGGSSAVPEPTTLGLLGVGAVGLLARRRRRNV